MAFMCTSLLPCHVQARPDTVRCEHAAESGDGASLCLRFKLHLSIPAALAIDTLRSVLHELTQQDLLGLVTAALQAAGYDPAAEQPTTEAVHLQLSELSGDGSGGISQVNSWLRGVPGFQPTFDALVVLLAAGALLMGEHHAPSPVPLSGGLQVALVHVVYLLLGWQPGAHDDALHDPAVCDMLRLMTEMGPAALAAMCQHNPWLRAAILSGYQHQQEYLALLGRANAHSEGQGKSKPPWGFVGALGAMLYWLQKGEQWVLAKAQRVAELPAPAAGKHISVRASNAELAARLQQLLKLPRFHQLGQAFECVLQESAGADDAPRVYAETVQNIWDYLTDLSDVDQLGFKLLGRILTGGGKLTRSCGVAWACCFAAAWSFMARACQQAAVLHGRCIAAAARE